MPSSTPLGRDAIQYEARIEDAKVFTRPWELRMPLYRRIEAGVRPLEYDCYAFRDVFKLPQ